MKSKLPRVILVLICVLIAVGVGWFLVSDVLEKQSVTELTSGLGHYFVLRNDRRQFCVIYAKTTNDKETGTGYIQKPVWGSRSPVGERDLLKQQPEIQEALDNTFGALDRKVEEYKAKYPASKIINCSIDSFSDEGITVTFYGLGILESGRYEEIQERVTELFGRDLDIEKAA